MLADPEALALEARSRPPVLLVHGDADPVLPVAALYAASATLQQEGFEVAAFASPGLAHSIDAAGLRLGEGFLKRVLA
jgi:phospholipase/carboxylesterase